MKPILAAAAVALALSATAAHADEDLTCPAAQQAFKTFVNLELRLAPSAASRATIHGRYDNASLQGEIADKFDAQNRPIPLSCAEALAREINTFDPKPPHLNANQKAYGCSILDWRVFCPSAGTGYCWKKGHDPWLGQPAEAIYLDSLSDADEKAAEKLCQGT
jgi:hypothetical protein